MNIIIPKLTTYNDSRGTIQMLFEGPPSLSLISSVAGSTRASHWHKEDLHYCTVLEGQIEYYERPNGSNDLPIKLLMNKGDTFYTAPTVEHTMYFPCYTVFYCVSKLSREQDSYESHTVRLPRSLRDVYKDRGYANIPPTPSEAAIKALMENFNG